MSDHAYVVNPFTPRLYAKNNISLQGRYDNKADFREKRFASIKTLRGLRRHRY